MKRCGDSGPTVLMHRDFGLGATDPRLLALPGPLKALARTGPTVEKSLLRPSSGHFEKYRISFFFANPLSDLCSVLFSFQGLLLCFHSAWVL